MYQARDCGQISIHALREEGDLMVAMSMSGGQSFLSTPSARRATGWASCTRLHQVYFYPRPPRGGRLRPAHPCAGRTDISIHALREEGDPACWSGRCGRSISIHALREEGDFRRSCSACRCSPISIHALREEGDDSAHRQCGKANISIHALREEGDVTLSAKDRV